MAIAGAAFGASKALEDILAEQMLRAQMEQRQKQAEAQLALQQRQMEGVEQDRDLFRELQTRDRDLADLKYRDKQAADATDRNVSLDASNVMSMPGMTPEQKAGELQLSVLRNPTAKSSTGMLKIIEGLTKKPARHAVTVNVGGKPVRKLVTEEELAAGVEEYREPKTPSGGPKTPLFVTMPDGSTVDINGIAPKGSKPYDEVRARQENKPISPQMLEYSRGLIRKIDDLIGKEDNPATPENEATENRITGRTAGVGGAVMRRMPWNNEAKDVDAELFSVASEVAIASLQKMRASSQTGGAVGNVALGEMEIMKNAVAAIQNNQSPLNLRRQLDIIRKSEQRYLDAMMQETPRPMSSRQGSSSSGTTPDDSDAEIARIRAARLKGKG